VAAFGDQPEIASNQIQTADHGNEAILADINPLALKLALGPFVTFIVIIGVFIYIRTRK
jgi:hypothetical protein